MATSKYKLDEFDASSETLILIGAVGTDGKVYPIPYDNLTGVIKTTGGGSGTGGTSGLTDGELRASPVPVSVPGTVALDPGTLEALEVIGLNEGTLAALETISVANFPATQPVSGRVTADAGVGPFPISDNGESITVDGVFWPGIQPVSGTFWPNTQPVSAEVLPLPTGAAAEATLVTRASEATLAAIKRGLTDYESRLDYDANNNLVYVGKAPNGTATNAAVWQIQKLSYTGVNLTRVQVLSGLTWDNRMTAGW